VNKAVEQPEVHALAVSGCQVPLHIHYESRINSRVAITKKGVILRISRYLSKIDKARQINEFKNWAMKKLLQRPELYASQKSDYYSGKVIAVRDKSFAIDLGFSDSATSTARFENGTLKIHVSTLLSEEEMEKIISRLIHKYVARLMHPWVHERLSYLNELHFPQKKFKALNLKYASSLWGSCSHEGNISISTRLLFSPDSVIDYVLVHELAHLIVPNHSKKFWDVVARAIPDFEASERWLREQGRRCEI
jgi:predicted metal-dependent hydrolase